MTVFDFFVYCLPEELLVFDAIVAARVNSSFCACISSICYFILLIRVFCYFLIISLFSKHFVSSASSSAISFIRLSGSLCANYCNCFKM